MNSAPERIYNWLNTQMSIARYCGGLTYMGHSYYVANNEEGAPLVRADVLKRERSEKIAKIKASKQLANLKSEQSQSSLV